MFTKITVFLTVFPFINFEFYSWASWRSLHICLHWLNSFSFLILLNCGWKIQWHWCIKSCSCFSWYFSMRNNYAVKSFWNYLSLSSLKWNSWVNWYVYLKSWYLWLLSKRNSWSKLIPLSVENFFDHILNNQCLISICSIWKSD